MHANAYAFVRRTVERVKRPIGLVVEIGGRNINGSVRSLFGDDPYLSVDLQDGPGVDVVADGATYVPRQKASTVVCCEVLEHAPNGDAICRQAFRILRPRGVFIVTAATEGRGPHSAVDGGSLRPGEFYRNVSVAQLTAWLAPFGTTEIETNRETADVYAVAIKGRR